MFRFLPTALLGVTLLTGHGYGVDAVNADDKPFLSGESVGLVNSDPIIEASGLAASHLNSNVLWTHNDKGDSARIFAINTQGDYLGAYTLGGASNVDYEDIAVGPGPDENVSYLYVGDIGNNDAGNSPRESITVYRVPEPVVSSVSSGVDTSVILSDADVDTLTLTYPDYARDAETLLVDPINGNLYIVTKRDGTNKVFLAASWGSGDQFSVLQYMGEMRQRDATAGDVSADGKEILIKNYRNVWYFQRALGADLADALIKPANGVLLPYEEEDQGEAIAFAPDGEGYYTLSEAASGENSVPLLFYARRNRIEDVRIKKARILISLSNGINPNQATALENYVILKDGKVVKLKSARYYPGEGGNPSKILLVTSSFEKDALLELAFSRTLLKIENAKDLIPGYAHIASVGSGKKIKYAASDGDEFIVSIRKGGLVNFAQRHTDYYTRLHLARTSKRGYRSVLDGSIVHANGDGLVLFDRLVIDNDRTLTSRLDPAHFLAGATSPQEAESLISASNGTLQGVLTY